jgi:hypothetical protein
LHGNVTMPRRALRLLQTGWCTPHTYGGNVYVACLVLAVLVLCTPCAQVPSPRSAALQPDYALIARASSDPASQVILYYHMSFRLCVLVAGRAGLVHVLHETECLAEAWASACCEADTRGELLGGFRPYRPRVASLYAGGDISNASWLACECTTLHR